MTPKYLEAFRQAAREAGGGGKSEVSEERGKSGGLNSLTSLYTPLPRSFGRFGRTFAVLESRCPDHVDVARWQQCIEDGRRFLATWGDQAQALGWTSADLFGLHKPPDKPHPHGRKRQVRPDRPLYAASMVASEKRAIPHVGRLDDHR